MIPQLTNDGVLPLGRYPATVAELEERFVPADASNQRKQVWADWQDLTAIIRTVVPSLPAVWMGGSFLTNKPEPGDVDSVYVIEDSRQQSYTEYQKAFLARVANSQVKPELSVDSFILNWKPRHGTKLHDPIYFARRGYWDDLWSRRRDSDKRLDSIPRRGYLEVMIDGYR